MAVVSHRTYQPTDLAGTERRAFLEEAKSGVARLRDRDGASLVMLPEAQLELLRELRTHLIAYASLENTLQRPREERRPTDFGGLAWADVLDDHDLETFRQEFRDTLTRSATASDLGPVEECVRAWRLTAKLLANPEAMARVNQDPSAEDYVEVERPVDDG